MTLASRHFSDVAFARVAVIRLDVVLVFHLKHTALRHGGIVHGETYAVAGYDQPLAIPAFPTRVARCAFSRFHVSNNHCSAP